ncbi:MAG: acyltransferase [Clostridiales Family XIII bacterium]|jgi:peptidoglycan/LPS O-acetylase OafA/YrhL|nr:acyltransferase [Clostridiales Family XIII bacterium]
MKLSHIRGIDSVRSVGVAIVVIYHLFTKLLPAGFFGVDVFFVISGFLVTSLFMKERMETGRIDLVGFYARRVKRLLPAAGFMVAVTLTLSLLISPDLRVGMRPQTAAVFGWITNYFEILTGQSYEDQFLPHLFVHTWTLGVEMQYYLIWGAVFCFAGFAYTRAANRLEHTPLSRRLVLFACCAGIAAFSYVRMQLRLAGMDDPSPVYYATSTRIYPLMIGSALGIFTGMRVPKKRLPLLVSLPLLALSVILIVLMSRLYSFADPATYRYGILVVSLLTVLALYCLLSLQLKKFFGDPKPLAMLGKRSYSIYLFHWPLYNIFRQLGTGGNGPFPENTPHLAYSLISIAATLVFAEISYRVFEQRPVAGKDRRAQRRSPNALFRAAVIGLCACAAVSVYTLMTVPVRTNIEEDFLHQQVLLNIGRMNQYNAYLIGLEMDPVALHAKEGQLPPMPSEIEAALDTEHDAQQTLDNAQSAGYREDPAGPVLPIAPPGGVNVTVLGDSVTLGAAEIIQQTLGSVNVDAKESRNMGAGVELVNEYESRGELGEYVVLALFTNAQNFTESATAETLDAIPPGHRVICVTPYGKDYMEETAAFVRRLTLWYDYVTIADWNEAIREHTDLLAPDGLHMHGDDSKQIYANLIAQAIEQAGGKPAKQ